MPAAYIANWFLMGPASKTTKLYMPTVHNIVGLQDINMLSNIISLLFCAHVS